MDDSAFLTQVRQQVDTVARELADVAALQPGQILVVGCSTSEVLGKRVGTAGSAEVAAAIFAPLWQLCGERGLFLAAQGCEHINRSLVVSEACAERYGLDIVSVVPVPKAGGAFAAHAIRHMPGAVVVEECKAHAGLDVGSVLIGMHLRKVAVPARLGLDMIGHARLTAARTRPKLIGGERAVYRLD